MTMTGLENPSKFQIENRSYFLKIVIIDRSLTFLDLFGGQAALKWHRSFNVHISVQWIHSLRNLNNSNISSYQKWEDLEAAIFALNVLLNDIIK